MRFFSVRNLIIISFLLEDKTSSGYSSFVKVSFYGNEIKRVQYPEDGNQYTISIIGLVSNKRIREKVLNYKNTMSNEEEAIKYYKDHGLI